jgi:ABC-type bacteriocin/lantibiotic exporter with double-glycine peptidase domain
VIDGSMTLGMMLAVQLSWGSSRAVEQLVQFAASAQDARIASSGLKRSVRSP